MYRSILLLLLGCLLATPVSASVYITEIGAFEPEGFEWVEIYNACEEPVDLSGWSFYEDETMHSMTLYAGSSTLAVGEFAIIADDAELLMSRMPSSSMTIFDSAWGSLKESGEEIGLYDAAMTAIDLFTYIASPDSSLEKKNYSATIYDETNWFAHPTSSSIGFPNYWAQSFENEEEATSTSSVEAEEKEITEIHVDAPVFYPEIILSEIMVDPSEGSEWIEVFVSTTVSSTLSGFTFHDLSGEILAPTSSVTTSGFIVFELKTNKLNNGGDALFLYNASSTLIDVVSYGNAPSSSVVAPGDNKTFGRNIISTSSPFFLTKDPTPGEANVFPEEEQEVEETAEEETPFSAPVGAIVINEFVSDPVDGEEEWIELYNKTSQTFFLDDWWIEDGSGAKTAISGEVGPEDFVIIQKPKGSLNNSGDMITLLDPSGKQIDTVSYGSWNDGNIADNAPVAADPKSIGRYDLGKDTDIDADDFGVLEVVSKGYKNSIAVTEKEEDTDTTEEKEDEKKTEKKKIIEPQPYSNLQITEVLPNPIGSDTDDEWIEIWNSGKTEIELQDVQIGDASTKRFSFGDQTIGAGAYYILYRSESGIALNNSGTESAILYQPSGSIIDEISWSGGAEGQSYTYYNGVYQWSLNPSPGSAQRSVQKGEDDVVAEEKEKIVEQGQDEAEEIAPLPMGGYVPILISEIIPNPEGSDESEFIELVNISDERIDLSHLFLDDNEGGSKPYKIPAGTIIEPGGYRAFFREETGLALNNTNDAARLLFPDKTLYLELSYETVIEGASYILWGEEYLWSAEPTPGEPNILEPISADKSDTSVSKRDSSSVLALSAIDHTDDGDRVTVTGLVSALPGMFSSQYFYISDLSSSTAGIQVYSYKKEFPEFEIGDVVEVTGEMGSINGARRIKVSAEDDIVIKNDSGELIPALMRIEQLQDGDDGSLVMIEGDITEKKSSYLWLDDGSSEIRVYFKEGASISSALFQVGQSVRVTGIVQQTKNGLQLLPRSQQDIETLLSEAEEAQVIDKTLPQEEIGSSQQRARGYMAATAGGLGSIFAGLVLRARGKEMLTYTTSIAIALKKIVSRK